MAKYFAGLLVALVWVWRSRTGIKRGGGVLRCLLKMKL